jgi:hypothetical protein
MCDLCNELNAKIERARRFLRDGQFDKITADRLKEAIASYEQQALTLVCKEKK